MSDISAEERVRKMDAAQAEVNKYEAWLRQMRLGARPGLEVRPIWWRRMVYAFGYDERELEPMSEGLAYQFYLFVEHQKALAEWERDLHKAWLDSEPTDG